MLNQLLTVSLVLEKLQGCGRNYQKKNPNELVSTQLYATRILHALIRTHECKYTVDINTHPVY